MNVELSGQEELAECLTGVILEDQDNGTGKPQEAHMDALKSVAVPHTKIVAVPHMKIVGVPHMKIVGVLHTQSVVVRHMVNLLPSAHQNEVDRRSLGLRSGVGLRGIYGSDLHRTTGRKNPRGLKDLAV